MHMENRRSEDVVQHVGVCSLVSCSAVWYIVLFSVPRQVSEHRPPHSSPVFRLRLEASATSSRRRLSSRPSPSCPPSSTRQCISRPDDVFRPASSRTAFRAAPSERHPKVQERQLILRVDKKKQKKSSSSSTSLWHDLSTTTTRTCAPSLIARDHTHASESAIAFIVASGGGGACRAILIAGLCAASRSCSRRMPPSEGLWSTSPASPRAGMCGELARALWPLGVWDCLGPKKSTM